MKKLLILSMVLAMAVITDQALALKYPHDSPNFCYCENGGYVYWEFTDDGCMPTSDEYDPPYCYYPDLDNPTFGSRHFDPVGGWGSDETYGVGFPWDWADGVYTVLSEDAITQSIPERGEKQYLRQYFEVVHTLVPDLDENDIRWPFGLAVELWDMSVYEWAGCPQGYQNLPGDEYLSGYEHVPPEIHYEIPGTPGWYKSVWIHDFSTDGSVGEQSFPDLHEVTHTACIVGMDLDPDAGEIFQIEEVVIDFIWHDDPCTIHTVPAGSMIGLSSVEIVPLQPSSSDVIAITLSGQWSNSCKPISSFVWIIGDKINFEVIPRYLACAGCFLMITPWELTDYVGPLSPGTYTIYGYMYRDPNSPVTVPVELQILARPGDFDEDGEVNCDDLRVLASAWMSKSGDDNWNPDCDISDPNDEVIDGQDFGVFAMYWEGCGDPPPEPGMSYNIENCDPGAKSAAGDKDGLRFSVTVEGNYLLFEDQMVANCCSEEQILEMTVEDNLITL